VAAKQAVKEGENRVTETTITNGLRNQIAEIENKRVLLEAERDDVSYEALVVRDKKAIERAAEIGTELAKLDHEDAMLKAALSTATRREAEAAASERASQKRADLERAESLLPKVAEMAAQMDEAMKTLREASASFEAHWSEIKRLSGAGPVGGAIKVHLDRAYRSTLRGLPLQLEMVPPNERHTVSELATGWSAQVRNVVSKSKPAKEAA
jgi:hypothetical protein